MRIGMHQVFVNMKTPMRDAGDVPKKLVPPLTAMEMVF